MNKNLEAPKTMNTFLQLVAESLLQRYGSNLSHLTVVFPGKRAGLFLDQALAEFSPTPVWSPRYTTISDLFLQASDYALCDTVEAVCRLYRVYAAHVEDAQSLDQFYSWGEILLSDFDDVDKHLADAHSLFANIHDIKALDDNSFLTPEQVDALRSFFRDFTLEDNTLLKERFLRLWNQMAVIYDELNASMRRDGLLYEGALQRDVVTRLSDASFVGKTFVFVGFNVLNDVEQHLFDELQRRGQALFFWDYDCAYADPQGRESHEAGFFIRQNLRRYGNELPPECFSNWQQARQLTMVAASSENAQARYIPQWLEAHKTDQENRTAVVLCNEQLLQPVLHAIPPTVKALNVTMGYPLSDTPVSSFVSVLLALQTEGYDIIHRRFRPAALRAVAAHPFTQLIDEALWQTKTSGARELLCYLTTILTTLGQALTKRDDNATENANADDEMHVAIATLYSEAVFVAYTRINRLVNLMSGDEPLLQVNERTLRRLVNDVLLSQSIPFHGEPAIGLQVMGVLETRALDFDHVLMLSVGEGFLPKSVTDTSFIPYHLKEAFGLTTAKHKIAVYAYYFYRLIQRAEHVTFVYNESNAGLRQNEVSRFLRQLQAETDFPIEHLQLQAAGDVLSPSPIVMDKTPEVMQRLVDHFDCTGLPFNERRRHLFSPSALKYYTNCPMQFYYRFVEELKVDLEEDDEFDAVRFGNVFHRAAELLYLELTSKGDVIRQQDIDALLELGGQKIERFVSQAFRDAYFKDKPEEYTGILLIARRVLNAYLTQLLRYDRRITPIRILGLEVVRTETFRVNAEGRQLELELGGIIDRLDQVSDPATPDGTLVRVLDYKTGGSPSSVTDVERLFSETAQNENYIFQVVLYSAIVEARMKKAVAPCLFYTHRSGSDDYSPLVRIAGKDVHSVGEPLAEGREALSIEFRQHLQSLLDEIFDAEKPFVQTQNAKACKTCPYSVLCGR